MGLFGGIPAAVGEKAEKTVIARGTRITGQIHTDALLLIDGIVEGDIVSSTEVSIGNNGRFKGTVTANHLTVNGSLEGQVRCDKLEILKSGLVKGDITIKDLTIEPGGCFYGQSHEAESLLVTVQDEPKKLLKA